MVRQSDGAEFPIIEHYILRNFWEVYIVESAHNEDDYAYAYVVGDYPEFGDVFLPEINKYKISKTKNLNEVMPAPGFYWKKEV